jgi:hypothetical protein
MPRFLQELVHGTSQILTIHPEPAYFSTREERSLGTGAIVGDIYRVASDLKRAHKKNRGRLEQMELGLYGK